MIKHWSLGLIGTVCALTNQHVIAAELTRVPVMLESLYAPSPSPDITSLDCPFGWLIGSWHARVVDYRDDGSIVRSDGEWHFAWVLEGRAIQDVWISPSKASRAHLQNGAPNRYGTSLRSFDPARKKWRVTWTNPISGSYDVLWTHRDGPDIVMEGVDDQGRRMRWGFSDIRSDSARWYGERSADGGKSWKLEAEFFLQRVSTSN